MIPMHKTSRAARTPLALAIAGAIAMALQPAAAFDFSRGELSGSLDTTCPSVLRRRGHPKICWPSPISTDHRRPDQRTHRRRPRTRALQVAANGLLGQPR